MTRRVQRNNDNTITIMAFWCVFLNRVFFTMHRARPPTSQPITRVRVGGGGRKHEPIFGQTADAVIDRHRIMLLLLLLI